MQHDPSQRGGCTSGRSPGRRVRRVVGQNAEVNDIPPAISAGSDELASGPAQSSEPAADGPWPLDAALGAASIAAKVAGGVATTVVSAAPVRAAGGVARWLAQPLVRQGHAVRESIATDGVPAIKDTVRRVAPAIIDAIDVDAVISAVDIGGLIDRVDIDGIVGRVDIGAIVDQVDIDRIISQLDLNALIGNVDLNALLTSVDLNALLSDVDLDSLIGELDMNALLDGLDLNQVLAQIDINALVSELDLNSVMDRIDVDGLIANTEMGAIIVRSTGGAASEALDAVRSQGVSIDTVVARIANRLLRRDLDSLPAGPPLLVDSHLALPAALPVDMAPAHDAADTAPAHGAAADSASDPTTGEGPR